MTKFFLPLIAAIALCGCTTSTSNVPVTQTPSGPVESDLLATGQAGLTGLENLFGNQDETGGGGNGPVGNTNPTGSPVSPGNDTLLDDTQDPQTGDDGDPNLDEG